MVDVISALLFFSNIFSFFFFIAIGCDTTLANYLNPFIVYEEEKVNWTLQNLRVLSRDKKI